MTQMLWLYCLVFLLPTESGRTFRQAASRNKEQVSAGPPNSGVCDGECADTASCIQHCPAGTQGNMEFLCRQKRWHKITDTCRTLTAFNIFEEDKFTFQTFEGPKINDHDSNTETITDLLMQRCPQDLSCVIKSIQNSPRIPGNIAFIVEMLHSISAMLTDVDEAKMKSYSIMANHILNSSTISNWAFIPDRKSGSVLLHSVNSFARNLFINKHPIDIADDFIHTMGTTFSRDDPGKNFTFSMRVNETGILVTGRVLISGNELEEVLPPSQAISATSIAFPTLGAILEASVLENVTVNGLVLSVILAQELKKVSLVFEKISKSEESRAQCVGWHSLESRWDQKACRMIQENSQQAVCTCQPSKLFTSFSILMAPHVSESPILIYITHIGLGISVCSLVICLSIEALVWAQVTKTEIAYLRHVCIVNIAATLLMADVWFIVASFLSVPMRDHSACVAATFFVHFFYLSVFFWMLAKALLILYGILIVFHTLPKSVLAASLFALGYGCPLVIAVITVAATEPGKGYLRPEACWLNWDMSKALLAFVVPVLAIVVVNLVTVTLVLLKTRQATIGNSTFPEASAIVRVGKNIAILTPLLGLTWGFGLATVTGGGSLALHIIFSLLNSFQGLFILVSGSILDPKIREALTDR
uniref:Adhesion G protein-coupled receptor F2 n=1 Tax=Catagonus wagneri TaxID=51154 RepID=A0A8C3WSD7_9CETA